MAKSAVEKLRTPQQAKIVQPLPPRVAHWGPPGASMVIPAPAEVDALVARIPKGMLATLATLRQSLAAQHGRRVPLFVKIAPDLDEARVNMIAATLKKNGVDGVVATNTTVARVAVRHLRHGDEVGGLSGAPVFEMSNRVIAQLRAALGSGFPIIGVGGVMSGQDALAKRAAGADLVQIYTGFVYRGPELVREAAEALKQGAPTR